MLTCCAFWSAHSISPLTERRSSTLLYILSIARGTHLLLEKIAAGLDSEQQQNNNVLYHTSEQKAWGNSLTAGK